MNSKRVKYIKDNYPSIPEEHIDLLKSIDVSDNNSYLVWLARMYSQGEFMYKNSLNENAFQSAKSILNAFHKNKSLLPKENRDINKFKSLFELSTSMFLLERGKKIDEENYLKNGAIKVFENNKWLIVKPLTMESAIKFGKDTTWCTSSKRRADNYFYSYFGKGEIFIIIDKTKKKRTSNSKYQFYFRFKDCGSLSECRNSNNTEVDEVKFFIENREIFNVLSKFESFSWRIYSHAKYFLLLENPTEEQMVNCIKSDYTIFKHIKSSKVTEKVQLAFLSHFYHKEDFEDWADFSYRFKQIENPFEKTKEIAIKVNPNLIKYIEKKYGKTSDDLRVVAISRKPNLISYLSNPSKKIIKLALHKKPELIEKIDKPTKKQQITAVNISSNLLRKIKNPHKDAIIVALKKGSSRLFKEYKNILSNKDIESIVKKNISLFKVIENPSEELQMEAIKNNYGFINYIKNPSKRVKSYATRKKNEYEKKKEKTISNIIKEYTNSKRHSKVYYHYDIDNYYNNSSKYFAKSSDSKDSIQKMIEFYLKEKYK